jgi:hypothetical protein
MPFADLIFGRPGQTADQWREELRVALELGVCDLESVRALSNIFGHVHGAADALSFLL